MINFEFQFFKFLTAKSISSEWIVMERKVIMCLCFIFLLVPGYDMCVMSMKLFYVHLQPFTSLHEVFSFADEDEVMRVFNLNYLSSKKRSHNRLK